MANNANDNGLTKPHDILVKATLSNPKAIQDFADTYFPKKVLETMDHSSLRLSNKSYVSADMKEFHDDVVFEFTLESYSGYAYCVIEHQSAPDRMLPLRFIQYQVNLITDHLKGKPDDTPWPIIIPICLYHNPNDKPYPYATRVYDCFTDSALAEEIGIFTNIHLKDYNLMSDTEIEKHGSIQLMEKLLKYSRHRDALNILMRELEDADITILCYKEYWKQIFIYIHNVVVSKDDGKESHRDLVNLFKKKLMLNQLEVKDMETIAEGIERKGIEIGLEEGKKIGIEQGIEKGIEQGIFNIAKNMLQKHVEIDFISAITGLSLEQIKALRAVLG